MSTKEMLDRLAVTVNTLAAKAANRSGRIEALIRVAEKHSTLMRSSSRTTAGYKLA
jgi:hypothetical protein